MNAPAPQTIFLKDYLPPNFLIDEIRLDFDLSPQETRVRSQISVRRNPKAKQDGALLLDGEELTLEQIKIDGRLVPDSEFTRTDKSLRLDVSGDTALIEIVTSIDPAKNTALEGLYMSNGMYCTQCEAEGFRRITYFPDRPDVMAKYTTRITADKTTHPILLSNGNLVGSGDAENGRHWAEWNDPFPKPSYLFALVAGDLRAVTDTFTTMSGRQVELQIYVEPGNEARCDYAMDSLKRAMKWDEEKYGREYDLDVFMIVAVADFNMGAMENKGLNIFNAKYVLANPETATDTDYSFIEGIVAHEYFHNWTGNRITCRDWFQLSLKEGLTVFRDQQFSGDMRSVPVKRIEDVKRLRLAQFAEDGGPLAHPVQPSAYIEINNFYTTTIYEKGAEVIRMMHTLLGEEGFRKGMDLYFERHDGEAATIEDFVSSMEDASNRDLGHFRKWYGQSGTPVVTASGAYNQNKESYELTLTQHTPPTPDGQTKEPLHIPVDMSLINENGAPMSVTSDDGRTSVLEFKQSEQTFTFKGVPSAPFPVLFQGFSAPVKLEGPIAQEGPITLMRHAPDPFVRWDAGQTVARDLMIAHINGDGFNSTTLTAMLDGLLATLEDTSLDPTFRAYALSIPTEREMAQALTPFDPASIHLARETLLDEIAGHLKNALQKTYDGISLKTEFSPDAEQAGQRALRNCALRHLARAERNAKLAYDQYQAANNMTDVVAALSVLIEHEVPETETAMNDFYEKWKDDVVVIDKWLTLHAMSPTESALERVEELMNHPAFSITRPNKVRALIGGFTAGNQLRFPRREREGLPVSDRQCDQIRRHQSPSCSTITFRVGRLAPA